MPLIIGAHGMRGSIEQAVEAHEQIAANLIDKALRQATKDTTP